MPSQHDHEYNIKKARGVRYSLQYCLPYLGLQTVPNTQQTLIEALRKGQKQDREAELHRSPVGTESCARMRHLRLAQFACRSHCAASHAVMLDLVDLGIEL